MKKLIPLIIAGGIGGLISFGLYQIFSPTSNHTAPIVQYATPTEFARYSTEIPNWDFTEAAAQTVPTVVHIRATAVVSNRSRRNEAPDFFRDFFGPSPRQRQGPERRQGSGSGVIISSDGFIVTNNHVIQDAEEVEVQLHDNRSFEAEVIGTDPSTDIALIKIKADDLSHILFANSDEVKVGEWVLAVGNPFSLASTVTAGIVSAKGRNINLIQGQAPIESFIQTDAAVNPGNSGGALVNRIGELIGINTAIATPTGVYAGYSFAVPSKIVAKVVEDLKTFGVVQRAYLGVYFRELNSDLAAELNLDVINGVHVDSLMPEGAAKASGILKGDVIIGVDEAAIEGSSDLLEQVGRHRPGDEISVRILRDGKEQTLSVRLKNRSGNTNIVQKEQPTLAIQLGVELEALTSREADRLGLRGGVRITDLNEGELSKQTRVREGFIITRINSAPVSTVSDVLDAIESAEGGVMLEGIYPGSNKKYYYAFGK